MNETNEKRLPGKLLRLGALILAAILVFHLASPAAGAISQEETEPVPTTVVLTAADHMALAEEAIARQEYEQAMLHLAGAEASADPALDISVLADVLVKTISIQILHGDYEKAITTIEENQNSGILLLDDTLPGLLEFLKAGCLMQTNRLQEAVTAFQKAMDLGYAKAVCLEQSMICSFELGNYEAVAFAGEKLLAIENVQLSDRTLFFQQLGISHVYLEDFEKGLESLVQANEASGQPNANGYYRGICLISLDRPQEAVEAFTDSIEEGSLVPYSYYNRGVCYLDLMEYEKAQTDMEKTVEAGEDPSLTEAAQSVLDQLTGY